MHEDHSGQPRLPKGRYRARAVAARLGLTSTQREQIAVEFELADPAWDGARITWYGFFGDDPGRGTKSPTEITIEALRACGWTGDDLSDLTGIDASQVELVVDHDTYNGGTRARVKYVNRPSGLALRAPMTLEQARAFAARMKGAVLQATRRSPPPPHAATTPASRSEAIPF